MNATSTCVLIALLGGAVHAQYRGPSGPPIVKRGATKNVAVEFYKAKGAFYIKVTALQGVEFAVKELSPDVPPSGLAFKDSAGKVVDFVLPRFSQGDKRITIGIDSSAGFTEIFGLKILDPVVVAVADDGTVEANRPGVRAVAFQGEATYEDCFLGAARSTDTEGRETFFIGGG
ncbi:MAG: hypothetical protein WD690_00845 [Vicinamibacterales bacterium]